MIPVTKPFLPPIEEYTSLLRGVWEREWLTNQGPLVVELESKLKAQLNLEGLLFVNNGTIALQIAIKALGLTGEIITTPFSFVATTSSIAWENCVPVFADIDEHTLNIDPHQIEKVITKRTSAILATHCFGNACDIDAIEAIARKNNLKVIYDAAHCFGTKFRNKSIFEFGDISTTSFHATKLFHTIEGGAIFSKDKNVIEKMKKMRNFGHAGPEKFDGVGINGKNSEVHAAMGLCNLKYINEILIQRKNQSIIYRNTLNNDNVRFVRIQEGCEFNYSYMPVIFESEKVLLAVKKSLEENGVSPRRYFYPSLSELDYVTNTNNTPVSGGVSKSILCLPLYHSLSEHEIVNVCKIINTICK